MSQSLDLIIAAKNTTDAAFKQMQTGLAGVQQEAVKTNEVIESSTDRFGKFADGVGKVSTTLARSASAFGLPIGPLKALDDVADVAALGLSNLATSSVGLNAATLSVAGAGLAAGIAFGTWLRTFPAISKAADDAAAALVRLFTSQKDLDAQANATQGLAEFQKRMAVSNDEAMKHQVQTMREAGATTEQIMDTLEGKRETSREKLLAGLKKEQEAAEKSAKAAAVAQEKAAKDSLKEWEDFYKKSIELMAFQVSETERAAKAITDLVGAQMVEAWKRVDEAAMTSGIVQVGALEMAIAVARQEILVNIERAAQHVKVMEVLAAEGRVSKEALEQARAALAALKAPADEAMASAFDLGEVVSSLGGLFEAMGDEAGNALEKLIAGLEKAVDAVVNLAAALATGNPAGVIASIAGSFDELKSAAGGLREFLGIEDGLLARMGLTATAAEKAAKQAKQDILNLSTEWLNAAGGLTVLQIAADRAGVSLDAVWNAKTVAEYESAVRRVNAAIALHEEATQGLRDAMERWGVEIGQLGPEFAQGMLHEEFAKLWQDFRLLEAAGVDMAEVLTGPLGDAIEGLVQQSLAAGVALPETMRPMIQQMIDLGQLFDENGEKITDISQLQFTESLEAGVQRLIDKIEDLVDALLGIHPIEVGVSYKVTGSVPPGVQGGGGEGGDLTLDQPEQRHHAAGAWFPYRPGGYQAGIVGEAGDEAIIPADKMAGIVAQAMAMAGGSRGCGGDVHITIPVYIGGDRLDTVYLRRKRAGFLEV